MGKFILSDENIEQMFRWIRESIVLMYVHHKHPVPMTAMIFAYMETFGKALGATKTIPKVKKFIETYMHGLINTLNLNNLNFNSDIYIEKQPCKISNIFGDYYRCGLVHQFWIKKGGALFENIDHYKPEVKAPLEYLWIKKRRNKKYFVGINIDLLVPDFLNAIAEYQVRIMSDKNERNRFEKAMLDC